MTTAGISAGCTGEYHQKEWAAYQGKGSKLFSDNSSLAFIRTDSWDTTSIWESTDPRPVTISDAI